MRVEVLADGGDPACRARACIDDLPGVGHVTVPLHRHGDALLGRYLLRGLPRGHYRLEHARLVVEDPFGLARHEVDLPATRHDRRLPAHLRARARCFPTAAARTAPPGGCLLSRGAGFDLHSVRDYQQGESLRRVHWPSTARRQKLMVKELEDAPRDEAAVVLDARAGPRGRLGTRFLLRDDRAGLGLARSPLAAEGRRASLVVSGARIERTGVTSVDGDWRAVLEVLARVQPDGRRSLAATLDDGRAGLDAARLFLVTSDLDARLADRVSAAQGRRELAIVWVDARTWHDGDRAPGLPDGIASTLARRGVAIARLSRGSDVAAVLSASAGAPREVAS